MSDSPGFWNWKIILIGAQMLFVAFGAMVLMPLLTGLDPSVALFTAGEINFIGLIVGSDILKQNMWRVSGGVFCIVKF